MNKKYLLLYAPIFCTCCNFWNLKYKKIKCIKMNIFNKHFQNVCSGLVKLSPYTKVLIKFNITKMTQSLDHHITKFHLFLRWKNILQRECGASLLQKDRRKEHEKAVLFDQGFGEPMLRGAFVLPLLGGHSRLLFKNKCKIDF